MARLPEWDETFLEEMMEEVQDAIKDACKSRKKLAKETLTMVSHRSLVTIIVRREAR